MFERTVNLNRKTLREFEEGDTLYIRRIEGDFSRIFYCNFIKVEKGMVFAEVIDTEQSYLKGKIGTVIKSRAAGCYLWGKREDDRWNRCHWFTSLDEEAI